MRFKSLHKKALLSFAIFIIVIFKYLIINILGVIPQYSNIHRIIATVVILPLLITGAFFSVFEIRDSYRQHSTALELYTDLNVIISLPALCVFLYIMVGIICAVFI